MPPPDPSKTSMFNLLGATPPALSRTRLASRAVIAALRDPHTVEELVALTALPAEDVSLALSSLRAARRVVVCERRRNTTRRGRVVVNVYRVRVIC